MALLETWLAAFISIPITIMVTFFLISIFKLQCAIHDAKSTSGARYHNEASSPKLFKWCGIICLCSFWIRSIIQSIVFLVLLVTDRDQEDHLDDPLIFSWFFYGAGLWLMLVSFVFRIQYSFQKHPYLQYSPWVIKILYFLLLVSLVLVILIAALDHPTGTAIAYVAISGHIVFSLLLSYFLFSKIFIVMHQRLDHRLGAAVRSAISTGRDDNDSTYNEYGGVATENLQSGDVDDGSGDRLETPDVDTRLSESVVEDEVVVNRSLNQIPLSSIKTVTRFALLMFIGMNSAQTIYSGKELKQFEFDRYSCPRNLGIISTYFASVFVFLDIEVGYSLSSHILTVGSTIMAVDLAVNALTVYLLFEYTTKTYYTCCGRCHRGCEYQCIRLLRWYVGRTDPSGVRNDFSDLILKDDSEDAVI